MKTDNDNYKEQTANEVCGSPSPYEAFKTEVARRLRSKLGQSRKYKVGTGSVTKLNGEQLDSISISRTGSDMAPTLYLNDLYGVFKEGASLDEITDMIYDCCMTEISDETERFRCIFDFDAIREYICVKLINTAANAEMLKTVPSISFLDLSVIFYIRIPESPEGSYHATIQNSMLESWNKDKSDLVRLAADNMKRLNPVKCCPVEQMIRELCGGPAKTPDISEPDEKPVSNMISVTSQTGNCGAVYMMDTALMQHYAEEFGDDVMIIPSSIHEVIIVPASMLSREKTDECICEVNRAAVKPREYLSDHSYIYRRESGKIEM